MLTLKYSPLLDTHNFKWFIYPSSECIHIMFWGEWYPFPDKWQSPKHFLEHIFFLTSVFCNLEKRKKPGRIGRMWQNMKLFFFQKLSHKLRFMCRSVAMKKSNVASSRLWSSFRNVWTFFQHIILKYISQDDRPFGIATYTTGPSLLQKTAYNTSFVLWLSFAVTGRFAFLINHILLSTFLWGSE